MELLAKWGLDILFALISACILGYAKYKTHEMRKTIA